MLKQVKQVTELWEATCSDFLRSVSLRWQVAGDETLEDEGAVERGKGDRVFQRSLCS